MKSPIQRTRLGALILTVIFVVALVGYRLSGYDWVGALWMVVVTISSVGFGEQSQLHPAVQLFTIGVIIFGMSAAAYTIGGLLQIMTEGEIERVLGSQRNARGIERLHDHVIICGYGRMGRILAEELKRQDHPLVVIDNDAERIAEAQSRGLLFLNGDATEEDSLLQAGVERARTMVSALPNDASNVFITLTSRNLNEDIQIIARADHPTTEKKLHQAGADRIVMPTIIGAHTMVRLITRPLTAHLMDLVTESTFLDLELDELTVTPESHLAGTTVRETEAHRLHRLLVVAIKQPDGEMVFNPDAEHTFCADDVIIIMGHMEDIDRFREQYGV